jgi:hypothetical protein
MGNAGDGAVVILTNTKSAKLSFGGPRRFGAAAVAGLFALALTAATAGVAFGQNNPAAPAGTPGPAAAPQTAPPPAAAPPLSPATSGPAIPPQPPPVEKRGFLNDFGHWWDDSIASFKAKMQEQQAKANDFNKTSVDAAKDAASATQQAMKSAADAIVRLPTSRVIEMQEVCALAGNGAPDCQAAAVNACRGKGFNTGQPVDIRTAEKCTTSLWVSGQNPASTDCPAETVVLRASCQ